MQVRLARWMGANNIPIEDDVAAGVLEFLDIAAKERARRRKRRGGASIGHREEDDEADEDAPQDEWGVGGDPAAMDDGEDGGAGGDGDGNQNGNGNGVVPTSLARSDGDEDSDADLLDGWDVDADGVGDADAADDDDDGCGYAVPKRASHPDAYLLPTLLAADRTPVVLSVLVTLPDTGTMGMGVKVVDFRGIDPVPTRPGDPPPAIGVASVVVISSFKYDILDRCRAKAAGLRVGDLIVATGDRVVSSPPSIIAAVKAALTAPDPGPGAARQLRLLVVRYSDPRALVRGLHDGLPTDRELQRDLAAQETHDKEARRKAEERALTAPAMAYAMHLAHPLRESAAGAPARLVGSVLALLFEVSHPFVVHQAWVDQWKEGAVRSTAWPLEIARALARVEAEAAPAGSSSSSSSYLTTR